VSIAALSAFGFYLEQPDNRMLGTTGWVLLFDLGVAVIVSSIVVWRRSGRLTPTAERPDEELKPAAPPSSLTE
jgi:hypothetical protein